MRRSSWKSSGPDFAKASSIDQNAPSIGGANLFADVLFQAT